MAKLGKPVELPFDYWNDNGFDQKKYDDLWKWINENHPNVLSFPRGDGQALYSVDEKYVLHHIPVGDAWTVEPALIRGLRKADIDAHLERQRALAALFGRK